MGVIPDKNLFIGEGSLESEVGHRGMVSPPPRSMKLFILLTTSLVQAITLGLRHDGTSLEQDEPAPKRTVPYMVQCPFSIVELL